MVLKLLEKLKKLFGSNNAAKTVEAKTVDEKIEEEEIVETSKKMKVAILGALPAPKIFLSFSNICNTKLSFFISIIYINLFFNGYFS